MTIHFTKMHGLGNDFMVIDAIGQKINLTPQDIVRLAKRDTGVGFDQCLLVERSPSPDSDFFYRIYNADGNEVGQCGNGARCLARFVHHYGLTQQKSIRVETHTTHMQLHINEDETVTVDMGLPRFLPADIPLKAQKEASLYRLPVNNEQYDVHVVNVGNPHAVMRVTHLTDINVSQWGQNISEHAFFPEQANAGFMQIRDSHEIDLRVYERGCGETQACGSGAVAAVAIGRKFHHLEKQVKVNLPGGVLLVNWPDMKASIYLTGPATFVYEGTLLNL